jgi:hypothetical protein
VEPERLGQAADRQGEDELRRDVERALGADERSPFGDVSRVVREERVQSLVLDVELDS